MLTTSRPDDNESCSTVDSSPPRSAQQFRLVEPMQCKIYQRFYSFSKGAWLPNLVSS